MKRLSTTIVILAIMLPVAAWANVTGTPTLTSGQILSLDTGTVVTSGGDILWNGSSITPQGSAKAFSLTALSSSFSGSSSFSVLTQSTLAGFSFEYSSAAIPLSSLAVNSIFAVLTNGGNYAALLVTAQSGSSITLQFVSFVSTVPTITQVLNNYGLIPAGFNNSGIAPGTLFIIKGSLLASATSVTSLQDSTAPAGLPTTLNGASVKVTVGSTTVTPAFYYAENIQLALVLPSSTPTGAGTVTVTYNGQTSAPFNIQVVASALGLNAYYGTGSGLAQAYSLGYSLYNYGSSIPPGTTIRMIGSGLGADSNPMRDTHYVTPSAASAINALAHLYIGGIDSSIVYQGPEGFPGLDEIDVTVPANAPTGCFISVVGVSAAGVTTNFLTLPIGSGQCQDPGLGFNGSTLISLSGQTTVKSGFVEMLYSTSPATSGSGTMVNTEASAVFQSTNGSAFGSGSGIVSIGGCSVNENLASIGGTSTSTGLNAGTIMVTGPNAAPATLMAAGSTLPGYYSAMLPSGFLTASGGSFQFQATAGSQVGAFTTSVNFPTPLLQWTNQAAAATVTRSAGQLITWTGGPAGTYVVISGTSSNASVTGFFTCLAPVAALQFTVPSYVLGTLPASTSGSLSVSNETVPQGFTATGIDYGFAVGYVSYQISAAYN